MTGCGCGGAKCRLAAGDARHGTANGYITRGCRCVACTAAKRESAARYYVENAEKVREYAARYYVENAEKVRERNARYHVENAEKVRERKARYHVENAEKVRERKARYRTSPEGKAVNRAGERRKRAKKRNLSCGCVTAATLAAVWALDGGLCAYCGDPGVDIDHVVPMSPFGALTKDVGGWDCINNLRVACVRCNQHWKSNRPLSHLLARLTTLGIPIRPGATSSGLPCPAAAARMAVRMLPASPGSPD